MLPVPTILMISVIGIVLLAVVTVVGTGSIAATLVVLLLGGLLIYVLMTMGVVNVDFKNGGVDVGFFEKAPAPAAPTTIVPEAKNLEMKEVFFVSGNDYTYDEAPALCAAYDADLATYDQVNEAYAAGAEWCGYGWSQGGMALYPTQSSTWQLLQQEMQESKRTGCGRPGVNGGYFNPSNKFGVNCFGVKPKMLKNVKFPMPLPGTDTKSFNRMVDYFKSMLSRLTVNSFNRDGWSEWNSQAHLPAAPASDSTHPKIVTNKSK